MSEEVNEFLEHHGIKGMHWGIRRDLDSDGGSGSGSSSGSGKKKFTGQDEAIAKSEYLAIPPIRRDKSEAKKALSESEAKSEAKTAPSEAENEKKHLTKNQKTLIKVGVGVAVVGGIAALAYWDEKDNQKISSELTHLAGQKIDAQKFEKGVKFSKLQTWGESGYIQPSSYERGEFSLPAGHTFHRISTKAEDSFNNATYATHNLDDFNRYVVGFRGEKGDAELHHITFTAKEELKVPSLTTALETLREVLSSDSAEATKEQAIMHYEDLSGGNWKSSKAASFMEALKKKGYDAFVDEMDAGVIGDSPLVLISPEKMSDKISESLSSDNISKAEQNLTELTSRKLGKYAQKAEAVHMTDAVDTFLEHHGVKGMHWGVHKAKKDAAEYTKAKLAYGEGAGNRRKLIKAKVESRSKNPEYKAAFDKFVAEQNLDKRARQAKVGHNTKTAAKKTYKTAKGVHRSLTGGFGTVSMASAGIAAAAIYAHKSGLDQAILNNTKSVVNDHKTKASVNAWLKSQGMM